MLTEHFEHPEYPPLHINCPFNKLKTTSKGGLQPPMRWEPLFCSHNAASPWANQKRLQPTILSTIAVEIAHLNRFTLLFFFTVIGERLKATAWGRLPWSQCTNITLNHDKVSIQGWTRTNTVCVMPYCMVIHFLCFCEWWYSWGDDKLLCSSQCWSCANTVSVMCADVQQNTFCALVSVIWTMSP